MKNNKMFEVFAVTAVVCFGIAILFLISIINPAILFAVMIGFFVIAVVVAVALSMWRIAEMQKNIDSILEIVKKLENRR